MFLDIVMEIEYKENGTYVRSDEVCNEIKSKTPPNGSEYVASDFCHPSH